MIPINMSKTNAYTVEYDVKFNDVQNPITHQKSRELDASSTITHGNQPCTQAPCHIAR